MGSEKRSCSLSFEPIYHRRVSQTRYIEIYNKTKNIEPSMEKKISAEREEILVEGFHIIEFRMVK